jgi:hypothetical protein
MFPALARELFSQAVVAPILLSVLRAARGKVPRGHRPAPSTLL